MSERTRKRSTHGQLHASPAWPPLRHNPDQPLPEPAQPLRQPQRHSHRAQEAGQHAPQDRPSYKCPVRPASPWRSRRHGAEEEQSPRARGRECGAAVVGEDEGATPASAGPRATPASTRPPPPSNPCERGAEDGPGRDRALAQEQPPRARGRDHDRHGVLQHLGATPASAGPSGRRGRTSGRRWGNPRERGAEISNEAGKAGDREQPPRARGRGRALGRVQAAAGATPASAGPRARELRCCPCQASNPRERGAEGSGASVLSLSSEQPRERGAERADPLAGSAAPEQPPRARGRGVLVVQFLRRLGATPASAGPSTA